IAIVHLVEIHCKVSCAGIETRGFDIGDSTPLGQSGDVGGHVGPALAAIARNLHQAVIGARPDDSRLPGRLGDSEYHARVLYADIVAGEAARKLLPALVVSCEIGTDDFPGVAAVGGDVDVLAADVNAGMIVRRNGDGELPVEAVFQFGGSGSAGLLGPHFHVARLAIAFVEDGYDTAHAAGARS